MQNFREIIIGVSVLLILYYGYNTFFGQSTILTERSFIKKETKIYHPRHEFIENEIALIYIGCSTCGPANAKFLPEVIESLKKKFQKKSNSKGYNFISIGISKDFEISKGLGHLAKFNNFDEIAVGRDWANIALKKYVWNDLSGKAATPQIILTRRKYNMIDESNLRKVDFRNSEEKILTRKIGAVEILALLEKDISLIK